MRRSHWHPRPSWRLLRWDVSCGLHSGIPACCTLWFTALELLGWPPWADRLRRWGLAYRAGGRGPGPGFVPCPYHRLRRTPARRLRPCPPGAHPSPR